MRTVFGLGPSPRFSRITGLLATVLLIACGLAISAEAQGQVADATQSPQSADLKSFAGTWKGEFKGQLFAVLKLHLDGQKLTGTLSTAQAISLDSDGALLEVNGQATESKATPVLDVTLVGNSLVFKNRAADGNEIDTCRMQLSGENAAGLKPDGVPETMKVKPFPLSRDTGKR